MSNPQLERSPAEKEFPPTPADGSRPGLNPPPLRWLSHEGVERWRVELSGPGGRRMEFGPLRDPVLALRKKLQPGEWSWQFVGLDRAGAEVGRGAVRRFTVRRGLPGFASPDVRRLERKWKGLRPRLFGRRIAELRADPERFAAERANLAEWCRLAESEPPIADPQGFGPHADDTEEHNRDWWRILSAGKVASGHAVRFALSWLLTGNERHLALARRWALNVLAWDPWGSTSLQICDEAGMPILERLGLVYDWLHGEWSDFERERFREVMLARGEEARERDRQVGFAGRPFFNHQCRTLAFTGYAAVAFLGEIPQAAEWLQYVLDVLAVSYPSGSWGSDDGGWSQGLSYWSAYMSWLVGFVAAADELGIELAAASYYRNTGYFAVYNLPPYAPRGGFGDHGEGGPGLNHKLVVGAFGTAARDGFLRAYAESVDVKWRPPAEVLATSGPVDGARLWGAWDLPEVKALLLSPAGDVAPRPISELPAAREFPHIGWAAMHSALGDAGRDAWLEFKSGPFGSVSHSHADQNSFNLFAYGEALLIDSGYYPWYGSVHDVLWTRQTWAHNAVLVGGHGQPPFDWFARGSIAAFAQKSPFAWARGEAAEAYNRPPNGRAVELAGKHVPELLERMGPAAEVRRASRSVLMVAGQRPFFVVLDWLETAAALRFQWLAHAFEEMELVPGGFNVRRSAARLAVRFVTPLNLEITQHDSFTYEPEGRCRGLPTQWHLSAETAAASDSARFMAVLVPWRDGEEPPAIRPVCGEGCVGAEVGRDLVIAPASGPAGEFRHGDIAAEAAAVALCGGRLFVAEGMSLTVAGKELLKASAPESRMVKAARRAH